MTDLGGRVLVTGASGFIGSAVVRAFLNDGFAVRAFVRPSRPRTNLLGLPVEIAEGDILDLPSIETALKGVRYLVHTAADYRLWTRRPSRLLAVNVDGTRNVMAAALKAGIEKVVYTSSVCTVARAEGRQAADEGLQVAPQAAYNLYKRSKVLAERIVRDFAQNLGLSAVIVNPSAPIGPRDIKPTPTGRVILECALGRMPAYVDTGLNLVHVDDVAMGHLRALKQGIPGERYILGGQNVRLCDVLAEIARQTGRKAPKVRLSTAVVYPVALASEGLAYLTGKPPFASRDSLRMAREVMFFDDGKARAALGHTSRFYGEAVADAIAWFREAGMLPARAGLAAVSPRVSKGSSSQP